MKEVPVTKPKKNNFIVSISVGAYCVFVYYLANPTTLSIHKAYLVERIDVTKNWLSVKYTLQNIRNLPETQ